MPHDGAITISLPTPPTNLRGIALFLDMDGVLAPLEATPDAVGPVSRRTAVLTALDKRLGGRLAIVSGRTLSEIDRISDGAARSASGVHGLERRRGDGSLDTAKASVSVRDAVLAFDAFASDRPGVIVEDKGLSAGLHYRGAPQHTEAATDLAETVSRDLGLTLQAGHMVLEVKTPGGDKGKAVTAFMSEPPFEGSMPIMLGDDLTDEYGFKAARALDGFGVLVGPERPTAATYRLDDVDAVLTWLEAVAEANL